MSGERQDSQRSIGRTIAIGIGFVAVVVVLMLWLAGAFHHKIDTAHREQGQAAAPQRVATDDMRIVEAHYLEIPQTEAAVGSIRAVHEASIASKILAKVVEVNVTAGESVEADDVLVRLDDADLQARLEQAEAAIRSAEAARDQAQIEFKRIDELHKDGQAAPIEFDRAQTALRTAEAELARTRQAREEAATVVGYATIRSPITGKVVDKLVEVGDTVQPGQVLLTLYDPTRMQLVARVRESLAHRLNVGQTVSVRVDALKKTCAGTVSEIVPEADTASRSFSVKVTGPCPDGIYSGMFGRMEIPLDQQQVLVVAQAAVRKVGQLNLVDVVEEEGAQKVLRRRAVELGKTFGDEVQVLAGLKAGEQVALTSDANG